MEQRIELVFAKDLSKLAGNTFGIKTYETQVKGKIDLSKFERKRTEIIEGKDNIYSNITIRIRPVRLQGFPMR